MLGQIGGQSATGAILCDFDGVLVDSETLRFETWREVFRIHEMRFPDLEAWLRYWFAALLKCEPRNPPVDLAGMDVRATVVGAMRNEFLTRYERGMLELQPRSGLLALLNEARRNNFATALVTNMPSDSVASWLDYHKLGMEFHIVVGRHPSRRPKPWPDAYLFALDELGVSGANSMAIEDSPHGIRAAMAAGIWTIGLQNAGVDAAWLEDADAVVAVRSREQLLKQFRRWRESSIDSDLHIQDAG